MADANPIVEALMDELAGRLGDVDTVQRVQRNADLVRAEIDVNAALHAEAAAQLAQARRRFVEAVFNAAVARLALQGQGLGLVLPVPLDDPEVTAHAAAYVEAAFNAAAARLALQDQEPPEGQGLGLVLPVPLDDPEVAAHAAAYVEAAGRVKLIKQNELLLVEALSFLAAARALAFAFSRAHLLPGVLVTAAAAYALAYVVSSGAVVPGPTSILRIAVLVLCLLLGLPVVGNLP